MNLDMPSGLASAIAPYVGESRSFRPPVVRGYSSDVTGVVEGSEGRFFIKGVRGEGGHRDSLLREAAVNPYVREFSPAVRWEAEEGDWLVLGFDVLDDIRAADLASGSADLTDVAAVLNRISDLPCPDVAHGWQETRWNRFLDNDADRALLHGDTLLHTDINAHNVLIAPDHTWVVDWSWPTVGAAFIDPALLVLQLVSGTHTPAEAEELAATCKAWKDADPRAVDVFVAATLRMQTKIAQRHPQETWIKAMLSATETWAEHRGVRPSGK
ncbi:protein kinase [Actinocorallia sp. API 0066]|uniref:protein kinase n=1 Tax=Actinocorallia sp. API 0066 TaxID=2896846 RepID=UPI001E360993|nr:protein kinase [Actinocorallia sp. API 0066]MCD0448158.1 protein kinase [Actinocorallia sp. API 0066]